MTREIDPCNKASYPVIRQLDHWVGDNAAQLLCSEVS